MVTVLGVGRLISHAEQVFVLYSRICVVGSIVSQENEMEFVTAYGPKVRHGIGFPEVSRTKQSFKEECDINNIMSKYQKTGLLDFVNEHEAQYGDATGIDFQEALETVRSAQEMFADMPSSVRRRFDNDPAAFLEFVNNPDNRDEAVELGLIKADKEVGTPPEVVEAAREPVVEPEA